MLLSCKLIGLETHVSKTAMFDMENVGKVGQLELLKQLEVSEELHQSIFEYVPNSGLDWFSAPSHMTDVEVLEKLNVGAYKLGSDDATNLPFLKEIAELGKPMIVSTGICTIKEVDESCGNNTIYWKQQSITFTCNYKLSTHANSVNLKAINTMQKRYPPVSDWLFRSYLKQLCMLGCGCYGCKYS